MKKKVLIVGAGKIGRGFIAHLFYKTGYQIWFLDASDTIVSQLNTAKRYRVDLAGPDGDETDYIEIEKALSLEDEEALVELLRDVPLLATSVGSNNIEPVTLYIKNLLLRSERREPLNWLICENATHPAQRMREVLLENADSLFEEFVLNKVGLIETQILRTGMPASQDVLQREPLAVRMQNWWSLPLDGDAFIGAIPDVVGFEPRSNFSNELVRKLYTFNGTNGPIAYIGWANGFNILHESALAFPEFFQQIQEESAFGLINEFGFDKTEQRTFMALAMKKYTDDSLRDQIERNAHDTRRKLSRDERMVGPALLCMKHGRTPDAYARAIAAAYFYKGSTDEGTLQVQQTIDQFGIEQAVQQYSEIGPSSPLYSLVIDSYHSKSFILK